MSWWLTKNRNLKTTWEKYYATQPQICDYLQQTAKDHHLNQFVKYNHEVMACDFLDDKGRWRLTIMPDNDPSKIFTDEADFLINGSGILNNWSWPDIPGFHDFRGVCLLEFDASTSLLFFFLLRK